MEVHRIHSNQGSSGPEMGEISPAKPVGSGFRDGGLLCGRFLDGRIESLTMRLLMAERNKFRTTSRQTKLATREDPRALVCPANDPEEAPSDVAAPNDDAIQSAT